MAQILKRFLTYLLYFISGVAVLAAGLVVYITWFQPPFYFPKPTGRYAVGIKTYHWVDTSRREILNDDPAHPNRELMVNVWYPAQGQLTGKPTTPYAPYLGNYFQQKQSLIWRKLSRPRYSYSKPNATLTTDRAQFPVILFSHGYGGTRDSNTAHCEELASHGYFVVGISHTYDSCVVEFPDGRIADGIKSMNNREIPKKIEAEPYKELEIWISDVHFVLDQLKQLALNKESFFYQRFDQKNIGMFGHSYGGAITTQVCRRDSRVKAGVNLDGPLYGPEATEKFNKPFMFMLAEDTIKAVQRSWTQADQRAFSIYSLDVENRFKARYLPAIKQLALSMKHNVYTFIVKNAGHMAFCDEALRKHVSLFSYFLRDLGTGSINGFRATEIVNAYLVSFFNKYLKNQPSELLDGSGKNYPEVEMKQWVNK